jgi:hypothetical protein
MFIEEFVNIQYFLFFLLVITRINRKVFQHMDFLNLVHTLVAMFLCFVDSHCKSESHRKLQTFELERHICRNHWNAWQQYIFSFEFSIYNCSFDDIFHHLFHWSLVTWSLGHLVTWSLGHLVTWSHGHLGTWSLDHLVTWSLGDKNFWACTLQLCKILLQSPQDTADHLVTSHLITYSLREFSI